MIVNYELVNKLIRLGESHATFSLHPRIEDIVDAHGQFKQDGQCYVRRYSGLADAGCPEDFSS